MTPDQEGPRRARAGYTRLAGARRKEIAALAADRYRSGASLADVAAWLHREHQVRVAPGTVRRYIDEAGAAIAEPGRNGEARRKQMEQAWKQDGDAEGEGS